VFANFISRAACQFQYVFILTRSRVLALEQCGRDRCLSGIRNELRFLFPHSYSYFFGFSDKSNFSANDSYLCFWLACRSRSWRLSSARPWFVHPRTSSTMAHSQYVGYLSFFVSQAVPTCVFALSLCKAMANSKSLNRSTGLPRSKNKKMVKSFSIFVPSV